jgi:hypothetical protein
MIEQTHRQNSHVEHHRYKLNNNAKADSMSLNGVHLKKTWKVFTSSQSVLDKSVRTKMNPDGILDYQKFIPATGVVTYDSLAYYRETAPSFRMEDMALKGYKELAEIARAFGLDPVGRPPHVLTRDILKAQAQISKDQGREVNRIPNPNEVLAEAEKMKAQQRYEALKKDPVSTDR